MLTTKEPKAASAIMINRLVATLVAGLLAFSLFFAMPGSAFADDTRDNLYASVQGEINTAAAYFAYANKAEQEGYPVIARLFRATADAEARHADDLWDFYVALGGSNTRPTAAPPVIGTTAQNLQTAIDGKTYVYTVMYPSFQAAAKKDAEDIEGLMEWGCDMPTAPETNLSDAANFFNLAGQAERAHALSFKDVLDNFANTAYINARYGTLFRCVICGDVVTSQPANCSICNARGTDFFGYNQTSTFYQTHLNLYASVQGETNAAAAYYAFADKAEEDGYSVIARLFKATADAEAKHADDLWDIYVALGGTETRPTAAPPAIGTTAQNLQTAKDGETYEYTVMYPGFYATAIAEKFDADPYNAARIFNLAKQAEEIHATNFKNVLDNLSNTSYLNDTYGTVYRCFICGEVVAALPATSCPICNASKSTFVSYAPKSEVVTPPTSSPTNNTWLYGFGIVTGCLLLGLVSYLVVRKRRPSQ